MPNHQGQQWKEDTNDFQILSQIKNNGVRNEPT